MAEDFVNRRNFLKRLGVVATAALTIVGVGVPVRRPATEYLHRTYFELLEIAGRPPSVFAVSQELFSAYERELLTCERYVHVGVRSDPPVRVLKFKSADVYVDPSFKGWEFCAG